MKFKRIARALLTSLCFDNASAGPGHPCTDSWSVTVNSGNIPAYRNYNIDDAQVEDDVSAAFTVSSHHYSKCY